MMKNLPSDNLKQQQMNSQNLKLKAIVSIRNLVCGLSNDWKELRSLGTEIDTLIQIASSKFISNTAASSHEQWMKELSEIEKNTTSLKNVMEEVAHRIDAKNPSNLAAHWDKYKEYSSDLNIRLQSLQKLGKTHLPELFHGDWGRDWDIITHKFEAIQQLAEGSSLHLTMISEFAPKEVDELTDTILRNMPLKYTIEEAVRYEEEYMNAYQELKSQGSKNKNLWDRFLDILAGGIQQSPAERVMMQRWVNGEKGEL